MLRFQLNTRQTYIGCDTDEKTVNRDEEICIVMTKIVYHNHIYIADKKVSV
jgi:hypothetical protein